MVELDFINAYIIYRNQNGQGKTLYCCFIEIESSESN